MISFEEAFYFSVRLERFTFLHIVMFELLNQMRFYQRVHRYFQLDHAYHRDS